VAWVPPRDDDPAPVRVAYAIPRALGGAVVRNRLRRRLRAMIAELAGGAALHPGRYLVGARDGSATLASTDLRRHLEAALAGAVRTDRRR